MSDSAEKKMPTDPEIANDLINNYLKEANKLPFNQSGVPILVKLISEALAEAKKEAENIIFNLEKMVLEYSGTTVPRLHLRIKELESQLTTIRSETIDECAKVAETEMKWFKEKDGNLALACTVLIVDAIRKLKG